MADQEVDYTQFKTVDEVTDEMDRRKSVVIRKLKQKGSLQEEKKDLVASYNSQIKVLEEEIDFEVGVIDQLEARMKEVELEANRPRVAKTVLTVP